MAAIFALDFDEDYFRAIVGEVSPNASRCWSFRDIVGPRDPFELIKLRELLRSYVKLGRSEDVDLFVLALGESPERERTKIGGLPYWRRDRTWPTSEDGAPLPFLAQFNFQQSRDLVRDIPGDILLLFAYPDVHTGVHMEWAQICDAGDLVVRETIPVPVLVPGWHGYRWRTQCFPDATLINDEETAVELADGAMFYDAPLLCRLIGMQVGRFPHVHPGARILDDGDQIICTLSSICPTAGVSFPFINYPESMDQEDADQNALMIMGYPAGADVLGMLHIIQSPNGTFRWRLVNA